MPCVICRTALGVSSGIHRTAGREVLSGLSNEKNSVFMLSDPVQEAEREDGDGRKHETDDLVASDLFLEDNDRPENRHKQDAAVVHRVEDRDVDEAEHGELIDSFIDSMGDEK